jgi:hypothetical protein
LTSSLSNSIKGHTFFNPEEDEVQATCLSFPEKKIAEGMEKKQ